jgi:3-deoxy-D-manno-octulosonate 8-phosphate phosphatase (KDO 8-P phosphatase)
MVSPTTPSSWRSMRTEGHPATHGIDAREIARRARHVRLVVTDCDGVLTDAGVYYSRHGEELRRFSVRDGHGVGRLLAAGIATVFLSGERSDCIVRRAEKLEVRAYLGVKDKAARLQEILAHHAVTLGELAYVGDDENDLEAMQQVASAGLTGCPVDAESAVVQVAHCIGTRPGGHGAFREFADWLLSHRRA